MSDQTNEGTRKKRSTVLVFSLSHAKVKLDITSTDNHSKFCIIDFKEQMPNLIYVNICFKIHCTLEFSCFAPKEEMGYRKSLNYADFGANMSCMHNSKTALVRDNEVYIDLLKFEKNL